MLYRKSLDHTRKRILVPDVKSDANLNISARFRRRRYDSSNFFRFVLWFMFTQSFEELTRISSSQEKQRRIDLSSGIINSAFLKYSSIQLEILMQSKHRRVKYTARFLNIVKYLHSRYLSRATSAGHKRASSPDAVGSTSDSVCLFGVLCFPLLCFIVIIICCVMFFDLSFYIQDLLSD